MTAKKGFDSWVAHRLLHNDERTFLMEKPSAHTVIVYSGGMDSTVLLYNLIADGIKTAAISFDYGSRHNHRELPMAKAFCQSLNVSHQIVPLSFVPELFKSALLCSGAPIPEGPYDVLTMKQTVVPFRNAILMGIAVGYAESIGAAEVVPASHGGDHAIYPDCRPEFNRAFAEAVRLGTDHQVSVRFPYENLDKRDIGDLGRRLGVDFSRTWTCYKGGEHHCGVCSACRERKYALRHEEGIDPTFYLHSEVTNTK
jgi:7-cyano-7-deazaguanine synthase